MRMHMKHAPMDNTPGAFCRADHIRSNSMRFCHYLKLQHSALVQNSRQSRALQPRPAHHARQIAWEGCRESQSETFQPSGGLQGGLPLHSSSHLQTARVYLLQQLSGVGIQPSRRVRMDPAADCCTQRLGGCRGGVPGSTAAGAPPSQCQAAQQRQHRYRPSAHLFSCHCSSP
jgi:hypothetical protein